LLIFIQKIIEVLVICDEPMHGVLEVATWKYESRFTSCHNYKISAQTADPIALINENAKRR